MLLISSWGPNYNSKYLYLYHGTIIRIRITCKKIPCYIRNSGCRWFILKKLKCFEVTLSIFEFSREWENVESWLVYANKFFWIAQLYFSTDIIKQSCLQLLFLAFQTFNEKKKKFLIKCYCFNRYNISILY